MCRARSAASANKLQWDHVDGFCQFSSTIINLLVAIIYSTCFFPHVHADKCRLVSLHIKRFLGMFCYLRLCDCDIMLLKLGVPKPVIRTSCRMKKCGKVWKRTSVNICVCVYGCVCVILWMCLFGWLAGWLVGWLSTCARVRLQWCLWSRVHVCRFGCVRMCASRSCWGWISSWCFYFAHEWPLRVIN